MEGSENLEHKTLTNVMNIIAYAGNAKSYTIEAIRACKTNDFKDANEKLRLAEDALNLAHNSQTELMTQEARGEPTEITLLTIHSQDHIMNAITFYDMAKEIIELFEIKR